MITEQEITQFERLGAVTIDTPLTATQIESAAAALNELLPFQPRTEGRPPAYRVGQTCSYYNPSLVEIIQHPFFEEVTKRVLRTDRVHFFQTAITISYPSPDVQSQPHEHTDIQYCTADLESVPRRMICSFFLWLSDVNEKRASMKFRPGSHRLIAAERDRHPELRNRIPTVEGASGDRLFQLDYAAPQPITAKAGQVSVLTTGMVHSASVNHDTEPRRVMVLTFTPAEIEIGLPENQNEQRWAYNKELMKHLRPDRVGIIPKPKGA